MQAVTEGLHMTGAIIGAMLVPHAAYVAGGVTRAGIDLMRTSSLDKEMLLLAALALPP